MHGASGSGKTCTQLLLLNEPPPKSVTDSTPIACSAVQATRVSIDDDNQNMKWKKVTTAELKNQLASDLGKAPKVVSQTSVEEAPKVVSQTSVEEAPKKTRTHQQNEREGKPLQKESVIEDIVEALPHAKVELHTNWAYFIDSGGQPAYREILPLFSRAAALNIIVIDLTKGLKKKYWSQYRTCQKNLCIKTELKYSNLDIIRSTISSEPILEPIKVPYVIETPSHPHYLIIGTRKDKLVTEEDIEAMNGTLIGCNFDHVIQKTYKSIIFPVNTLLPDKSKEREEASVELCRVISNCNASMKIKMPIRLFAFEISLQTKAEEKKRRFLTKKEVVAIGERLQLNKEEVKKALQYLHNVTIILYYPKVLKNVVFVDPQPILNILSRLIAITYVDQDQLHFIANDSKILQDAKHNLSTSGCFKEELLHIVGDESVFVHKQFKPCHMIELLKHLHIIAEVKNRKEGDYFLPCALPSYDKSPPPSTEIKPLLVVWMKDKKVTLPVPQGVFPLIVVHLLNQKDEVDFSPSDPDYYYKCHNAMSLRVYERYTLHIINRYTHIELYFNGDKKCCPEVWGLVDEAIKKSSNDIHVEQTHTRAFKCPRNTKKNCYCIVENVHSCIVKNDRFTKCTMCPSPYEIPQNDENYWCWFNDSRNRWPTCFIAITILVAMVAIIAGVYIYTLSGQINIGTPNNYKRSRNEHTSSLNSPSVGKSLETTDLADIILILKKSNFDFSTWDDLCLSIGLYDMTINTIQSDKRGVARDCLKSCLTKWLNRVDKVDDKGGATWESLGNALVAIGQKPVAEKLQHNRKG